MPLIDITLAHASDPHLTMDSLHIRPRDLLNKRALSYLSWQRRRRRHQARTLQRVMDDIIAHDVDMLALTGDLTNLGLPDECAQAARWLSRLPMPVTVIPGNHDALVRSDWHETIGRWSAWMGPLPFPYIRRIGPVALIGVNSAHPTPCFCAAGSIGARQCARLATILDETGRQGLYRVIMIHHPPLARLTTPRKSLRDADGFAACIARNGAELVLHGHTHVSTQTTMPGPVGPVPVVGVASASACVADPARAASWNRVRISTLPDGYRTEITRRIILPGEAPLGTPPIIFTATAASPRLSGISSP
ncbi:metallophosphoesterase family protein [Novacetimonas cocois]|uniref:metallophosphoesterase family protein n=1 Tax=Novacetimonas cocois TaxID=1747507 RepID=UPI001EEF7CE5|nr:metallophosphoesterase [Novacetimonas cocois]